jgi:hypothetical protein
MFVSTVLVVVASLQLTSSAPLAAGATVDWRENGCLIDSWNRALGAWQFADETMTRSKCQSTCQSKVGSASLVTPRSFHRDTLTPGLRLVRSVSVPTG